MAIAQGTNPAPVGGSATPWTFTASDYPSLVMWANFKEATGGNGGNLADLVGNFNDTDNTELILSVAGAGDPWTVNGGMTSSNAGGAEVFGRLKSTATDSIPAALRAIGSNPVIMEMDINLTGGDHTAGIFEFGISSSSVGGIKFGWNSSNYPQLLLRGTASAGPYNMTALTDLHTRGRTHLLMVWDRSAGDTAGTINVYVDGILHDFTTGVTDYVPAADPGAINIGASGSVGLGTNTALSAHVNATFYNVRLWQPSTIPANIATIASELASNPDHLPVSAQSL